MSKIDWSHHPEIRRRYIQEASCVTSPEDLEFIRECLALALSHNVDTLPEDDPLYISITTAYVLNAHRITCREPALTIHQIGDKLGNRDKEIMRQRYHTQSSHVLPIDSVDHLANILFDANQKIIP